MILNELFQKNASNKRHFDPSKKEDLDEFHYFLTNKKWKNVCPFFLEWPYLTVPDMIKDKITRNVLA